MKLFKFSIPTPLLLSILFLHAGILHANIPFNNLHASNIKDTNHLTKKLYDTKTGTSVEAVIDHRMFTKEGREEIAGEFKQVADTLDDINRYVKDKAGDYRLTDDLKNNIEQNGIKDSLVDYLSKAGASDEDIQKILDNEKVQSLLEGYQEDKKINREYEITQDENNQDTITLNPIVVTPSKDLKDYIVDGAGAINAIVEIVGEDKAAMAILITQFAIQGTVKTATSIMGDEAKDVVFGGVKNRLSDFIADEFFDVSDNEYWNNNEQKSINSLSYMISDFTVDAVVIGGAYAIIKKADKVAKTDSEFTGTITNKIDNDVDVNPIFLNELTNKGVKFTPENVIATTRASNGQIVFLETGKIGEKGSGLAHITERHSKDFFNIGVSENQIPKVIMQAISENKIVKTIGSGANARNVYEVTIGNSVKRIAVGIGNNGYIVTAYPY